MEAVYTGRKDILWEGRDHFAEVTIRISPAEERSQVVLSRESLEYLRSEFGEDFELQRHNTWAAVSAHFNIMSGFAKTLPRSGPSFFHAEVTSIRVSGNSARQLSGVLLSAAGMNAVLEYFEAWKSAYGIR